MTPAEFARALGVGRAAVSKIEANLTKTLQLDTALKIQRLTRVSASWLRTGRGAVMYSESKDEQVTRIIAKLETLPQEARDKTEADIDYILSLLQ